MFSKPPPPPPSSPELDESALITAAVLVVLTIAALYFSNKAAMPPLKTPKELAAAKALRSKLSDPALLVEFGASAAAGPHLRRAYPTAPGF